MSAEELRTLIAIGYEQVGVEFKPPGPRTDKRLFAWVVRAILGMANRRDGGKVVIGIEEHKRVPVPVGLHAADLATWNLDDVMAGLVNYTDPFVEIDLRIVDMDGLQFVILDVAEFLEVPILCAKDFDDILTQGRCYVRTRRKPETNEIPSQSEMRELLDLAIDKGVRRFMHRASAAGLRPTAFVSDRAEFDAQVRDLL